MILIKKNQILFSLRKSIIVIFLTGSFLVGSVVPLFPARAENSQNIMPIGTLLYKTSDNGKIYGKNTPDIFKIHFWQNHHLVKIELNSGHVGIYVGKISGKNMVVEAVPRGVIMDPLKYFVNLRYGSKFLGAKIPKNSTQGQRKAAAAIARALAQLKLKYDFDYRQQKGPKSGDWTCVGLTEKVYESADVNKVKNLKINQADRRRNVFKILTYNPSQYFINITPDGYDNKSIYNPQNGDVFSQTKEFSKISRRKNYGELIGTDCGREYQDQRYFFFPYTQFLQPTLKDIHLTKNQIAQLEINYDKATESLKKGKAPRGKVAFSWMANNLTSSAKITTHKTIVLARKIETKVKTATIKIAQKSKKLIKGAGTKIKSLFSKRTVNHNFSANINLNSHSLLNKDNKNKVNKSASNLKSNATNTLVSTSSSTIPQSTLSTPSPNPNPPQQINNQTSQLIQPTPVPVPTLTSTPTSTPTPTSTVVSQLNNLPIQKPKTKSPPIIAFIPPPGVPNVPSNENNNLLNTSANIPITLEGTTTATSTNVHLTTTTPATPKIYYHSKLVISTTTQPNCFSFSAQLTATTSATSTANQSPIVSPNLSYHWQFLGLATSSATSSSTTAPLNPSIIASSTEATATSALTRCFSPISLNGSRINQLKINLSVATTSTTTSAKNLSILATTSQTVALPPLSPIKIILANWLEQKRFLTLKMIYSTSGSFYLLGKNDLTTSTPNSTSTDLILSGEINQPAEIKIFSTSTLTTSTDGQISTSSTSTKATFSTTNFKFTYPLQNSSSTNLIHWQKKIHLSTGDFSNYNFFDGSINPKSGNGWNEVSIQAKPLGNSTTSTTTKITIKVDTSVPELIGATATSTDSDTISGWGQIELNWPLIGEMISHSPLLFPEPPDVDSYLIHYSTTSTTSNSSTSLRQWWDNSSSSEIIVKNNNRLAPTDNNPPKIIFNSTSSIFTIATSSAIFELGGSATLSLKPEYLNYSHLQQPYYSFVRAKDFAGNISDLQPGYQLASSTPSHLFNHLVIQEIRLDNSSSSQPYIEIYNPPTNATTSLENLYLFYIGRESATSSTSTKIEVSATTTQIASDSFYLIAATSTATSTEEKSVDKLYKSLHLSSESGSLILASTSTDFTNQEFIDLLATSTPDWIIDRLAWQNSSSTSNILLPEGEPIRFTPNDKNLSVILGRRILGWDIDDNNQDFTLK